MDMKIIRNWRKINMRNKFILVRKPNIMEVCHNQLWQIKVQNEINTKPIVHANTKKKQSKCHFVEDAITDQ